MVLGLTRSGETLVTCIFAFAMVGVVGGRAQVEACRDTSLVFCSATIATKLVHGHCTRAGCGTRTCTHIGSLIEDSHGY